MIRMNILLMRHAKSSWDHPGLADHDRPLAERGKRDAPKMGRMLKKTGLTPGHIITSTARRALETANLVAGHSGFNPEKIETDRGLYFSSSEDYLKAIQRTSHKVETVMLVGHNPLMEEVCSQLVTMRDRLSVRFPTAAIACLRFDGRSWSDCEPGVNQLVWFVNPKIISKIL